ncbi:MAG: four helix bundle protein [Candidatus Pacebacteria bacterium]|jgi:four helix bundle protein|nr:four helix bundle protein [Candidatus Paceibacterota bacterium]MBP9780622.1 four helix bundle protein [Candidatus Paceibacterota bacterium]
MQNSFQEELKNLADEYAHSVYSVTKKFPKDEQFGITSQLRRSSLSVPLNIVEGYARNSKNTFRNFLEIAFGSLKESLYLIDFSQKENYISEEKSLELKKIGDRISGMLWGTIQKLKE